MKLALIATRKITNADKYIPKNCTRVMTNIQGLSSPSVEVIYDTNLDEIIRNADFVTALCSRKTKKRPAIIARCKRYAKSFEFFFYD